MTAQAGPLRRLLSRFGTGWTRRLGTKLFGDAGERLAARHLRKQGLRIVARQHRSRLGEIDLIAVDPADGGRVVFVEVKTRRGDSAGRPEDAVDAAKQKRLTRLSLEYLKRRGWLGVRAARFDVVAITWPADGSPPAVRHYRHAFEATGVTGMFS